MNQPLNNPGYYYYPNLQEAFLAAAKTECGSPAEREALTRYSRCLVLATHIDVRQALCQVTMNYADALGIRSEQDSAINVRETMRASWLWLFRRAAKSDPGEATFIMGYIGQCKEYEALRKAAEKVGTQFRAPSLV